MSGGFSAILSKDFIFAKGAFFLGCLALLLCLGLSSRWRPLDVGPYRTPEQCEKILADGNKVVESIPADDVGILRLIGVFPSTVAIGQKLCIGVAGVAPKSLKDGLEAKVVEQAAKLQAAKHDYDRAENKEAARKVLESISATYAAALSGREAPDTALHVFLDNDAIPGLKLPAKAVPEPQFLMVDFDVEVDSATDAGKFWRTLLGGTFSSKTMGQKQVTVGVARLSDDIPATEGETLTFVVFVKWISISGLAALLAFLAGSISLGRHTNLLRDSTRKETPAPQAPEFAAAKERIAAVLEQLSRSGVDPATQPWLAEANKEAKEAGDLLSKIDTQPVAATPPVLPYSLAKVQVGLWAFLILAGFVFIWLSLGQHQNLVTAGVLALLGIQVASTVTSTQINSVHDAEVFKYISQGSRGFWSDILSDGGGVSLGRLQAVAWTVVLMIIFVWSTLWNFTFPNFDTNLLILLGITQSAYLGMKYVNLSAKP